VSADIRERAGAERIVATALDRVGRVDLVLHNAGGQYIFPAEGLATKGCGPPPQCRRDARDVRCRVRARDARCRRRHDH
jgi:hypothetical protein